MSEPNFIETLSGAKGLVPDFNAAMKHVQSISEEEADLIVTAVLYESVEDAEQELGEAFARREAGEIQGDSREVLVDSVKAVEAIWALAKNGDKSKMSGFPGHSFVGQIAINDEEYMPVVKESKRETRLVVTNSPSFADDTLSIFMLSGAGKLAGFDDLDTGGFEESAVVLEELKEKYLADPDQEVHEGPDI